MSLKKKRTIVVGVAALVPMVVLAYVLGRANAAGLPTMPPLMTYSGTLTDPNGAPLTGSKNVQLQVWSQASGGATPACQTTSAPQTLVGGVFQVALPDTCTPAVRASGDLWIEVLVDGATLGRTKIGAVPFAIEAGSASAAAGALDTRLASLMPPKAVVYAALTAAEVTAAFDASGLGKAPGAYAGWAICNGANGTPNLANKFVRTSVTASGAVGGSDTVAAHSHAIDHDHAAFTSGAEAGHTHATPAHQHLLPIGVDANNYFWAVDAGNAPLYGNIVTTVLRSVPGTGGAASFGSGPARLAYSDNAGAGNTGAGTSHSHPIDPPAFAGTSSAAPATDNRPSYAELVALMRL